MAMEAPKQLDLTFTKSVRLLKVRMQRDGTELDIGFNLFAAATNVFAVSLPELNNASYEINQTVTDGDSHQVQGKHSFTVGMYSDLAIMPVMKDFPRDL